MSEPTPQSNLNKITELQGEIKTFRATVKGSTDKIEQAAQSQKESVDDLKELQKDFFKEQKDTSRRIHSRISEVEQHVDEVDKMAEINRNQIVSHEKDYGLLRTDQKDSKKAMSGWAKASIGFLISVVLFIAGMALG